ncbi:MAG: cytochrome c peroxidase [Thermodesulfobacteriota bacterium]
MITPARVIIFVLIPFLVSGLHVRVYGAGIEFGPGDVKEGYKSSEYETRSFSLIKRTGKPADLQAVLKSPPLGLPPVSIPKDNPITFEKIQLGRKLFFDRRLSLNGTMSCAMCHIPEQGFTNNELATAVGIEGRTVRRNAPTLYNVAYFANIFHDGREKRLEYQVWLPMLAVNEMANPSIGWVVEIIQQLSDYEGLFEAAFNGRGPGVETIGMAIASYERTLISGNSTFDRWYYGGEEKALDESAKRGFRLFTGKGQCSLCHRVNDNYSLFTDDDFHNTGIGWYESVGEEPASYPVQLSPGVVVQMPAKVIESVEEPKPGDIGRYEVTLDPADRWSYKTPSLRNVELTAPYMHNGKLNTLREVVDFYAKGGVANPYLDPLITPKGFTNREKVDLVSFLKSITGDNIRILVRDAFASPIGDHN